MAIFGYKKSTSMEINSQSSVSTGPPFFQECEWNLVQLGLMSSFTMSLSAFWMFPYAVYKHTALFLVAYYILLVLVCIPVSYIQLKLGAVFKKGIVAIFSTYMPASKGVAATFLLISFIFCLFNGAYVAYGIYYMLLSLKYPYSWADGYSNLTNSYNLSMAEHYYIEQFLQKSPSLYEPGIVPWYMGLTLFAGWVIALSMIIRGPSWYGKVIQGTSPTAIVLMIMFLIYSHTAIPSANQSLSHIFRSPRKAQLANELHLSDEHWAGYSSNNVNPVMTNDLMNNTMSPLYYPQMWIKALEQHVYNVGLWAGLLPTVGLHLGNKMPAGKMSWLIITLIHSMLPHISTIAMAPFVLHAPEKAQLDKYSYNSGPYLLFVVLPGSFASLDVSPFWPFIFYLSFVLFILHHQTLLLLTIMENLEEGFPTFVKFIFRRPEIFSTALCIFSFLISLPLVTQGGAYILEQLDLYLYKTIFIVIGLAIPPVFIAYVKLEQFHLPIERLCMSIWFSVASLSSSVLLAYNYYLMPHQKLQDMLEPLGCMIAIGPLIVGLILGIAHALYEGSDDWIISRVEEIFRPPVDDLYDEQPDMYGEINGVPVARENPPRPVRKKKRRHHKRRSKDNADSQKSLSEVSIPTKERCAVSAV